MAVICLDIARTETVVHICPSIDVGIPIRRTKIFRDGNAQAALTPAELAYVRNDIELVIERIGDQLHIRAARRSLGGVLVKFADFGSDMMADGRGAREQSEREAR